MGVDLTWELWCSNCYEAHPDPNGESEEMVRYNATEQGWGSTEGLDLCPKCAKEADDDA